MSRRLSDSEGSAGDSLAREDLPLELRIALQRGYLRPVQIKLALARVREREQSPFEALKELRFLSERRLARLMKHVRYRILRKEERRYARLARERGLDADAIQQAREVQRRRFEERRECVRLGTLLVEAGLLTAEEDRDLVRALGRAASARLAA